MALILLRATLTSAAAAGVQQLDVLRRIGPTTSQAGPAFIKSAGVVLAAHAQTYSDALKRLEESEAEMGGAQNSTRLLSAAMGSLSEGCACGRRHTMTSPLLGTAMVLLSEGCTYGAKGALRLTTRGACEAHAWRGIGFRR